MLSTILTGLGEKQGCTEATDIREQGFSGAAMLPYSELEYGGS